MDNRIRESVFPIAIYEAKGEIHGKEFLTEATDLQVGLSETHLTCVKGKGYIVLDFGRELHGCVRILTQVVEDGGCKVRIRTGESVSEAYAELGERNANNHHSMRDLETILPIYSDLEFFQTGFRYARIDFLEEKTVYIKSVLATYVHRDLKPLGGFVCDDSRVNEIFEVASRTLMLNMQNYIWDGIKRDRLVWVGDMHPETTAIACLFGADETVEKSLDYVVQHTPLTEWMNAIPSYTAWWIVVVHDYYLQNANRAFIEKNKDYIRGALSLMNGAVSEQGEIKTDNVDLFDWPSHNSADEKRGITALWSLAAKDGLALCEELEIDNGVCLELIAKLSRADVSGAKQWKQCEAFLVYAGLKRAEDSYAFLTNDGAKGFSTFMSYYLLTAIALSSNVRQAVEAMKEYYGGMLDMGATSFWEDFNLDWMKNSAPITRLPEKGESDIHGDFGDHCYVGFRHSLCHGWSCGPVPFLMKQIGGIEVLEAGCRKVRITPVATVFKWYEIKYPTPYGLIEISMKDGKTNVKVPKGITVVK